MTESDEMMASLAQAAPLPPEAPWTNLGEAAPLLGMAVLVLGGASVLWPIARAYARRIERGGVADPGLRSELEELRARFAELEAGHARLAELEERLDFAERVIARREPEHPALGRGD